MSTAFANDNGMMFWPPECELARWDKPVAQAWEKWAFADQRREVMERKNLLRCEHKTWIPREEFVPGGPAYRYCKAEGVGVRWAREHGLTAHPGEQVTFNYVHARWIYEMMGFEDLYDGRPQAWYNLLDGDDPSVRQWERDALELGTAAADYWWFAVEATA